MHIFIMRHGDASLNINRTNDSIRPLSSHGYNEVSKIAYWLKSNQQIKNIEMVWVSPYLRAKQTLEKLREQLKLPQQNIMSDLTPNGDVNIIVQNLQIIAHKKVNSVLIISHFPLITYLVSILSKKQTSSAFCTSSIACIDFNGYTCTGKLKWLISPSMLNNF